MCAIRKRYPQVIRGVQERSLFLQGQNIRAGLSMGRCGFCRSYMCNVPAFVFI